MANMTDISISDFQLPGDDPAGGISLAVTTKLTNPSAFGVQIGYLTVGLYYNDLFLGLVLFQTRLLNRLELVSNRWSSLK
jgi:hypothetical protein